MLRRRNTEEGPGQPSAEVSHPAPVVKPTNFMEGWLDHVQGCSSLYLEEGRGELMKESSYI